MNVNNQEENKKLSKVFIISLFFVCILITALIVCAFFFSEDKFVITKSIITLLCLLVVLVLSNSFDRIHFGNLFELSKKIDVSNDKITKLDEKSERYFNQILSCNTKTQINPTFNATIKMQSLDENDKKAIQEDFTKFSEEKRKGKRLDINKFCDLVLTKYGPYQYKKDIALVGVSDSISDRKVDFNAVIEDGNKKLFIEVMKTHLYMLYHDRIYIKLNKILSYKNENHVDTKLLLLVPKEKGADKYSDTEKLKEWFAPAILNGLLEIQNVEYDKAERDSCLIELKKNQKILFLNK